MSAPYTPRLFRRCVECPPDIPSCPECPGGQTCVLQSRSCDACPSASCINEGNLPGQAEPEKATSTPAIAGGVIGGVMFIVITTFLVWWFCIRRRRQEWDEQVWQPDNDQVVSGLEKRDQSGLHRGARESTRSMGSIASTVRTRASNVIQIAYIPGVTNRSPADSPGLIAPPIPPIPAASGTTNSAPQSPTFSQGRRFLATDDARQSSYSDTSHRQSISPSLARASNATAIYRSQAEVVPRPAQQVLLGKAAVVKIGGVPDAGPAEDASSSKSQPSRAIMNSPMVARNVAARPIEVKRSNSSKKSSIPTLSNLQAVNANNLLHQSPRAADGSARSSHDQTQTRSEGDGQSQADGEQDLVSSIRSAHQSAAATLIEDSPAVNQSQFTDSSSSASSLSDATPFVAAKSRQPSNQNSPSASPRHSVARSGDRLSARHRKSGSLNSLAEEATTRAAREHGHGGLGSISEHHGDYPSNNHPLNQGLQGQVSQTHQRTGSASEGGPFSDSNEMTEPSSRSSRG